MDKYSVRNPESSNKGNVGSYKVVPLSDSSDLGVRRRDSKKYNEMEETPFVDSYKGKVVPKAKETSGKKNKKTSCFKNAIEYFCNFCDNTSIHGFKFLGEHGRYIIEKIFWFLVILGAIYGSSNLIYKTYRKWLSSPVVVTFAMTETPIWKIPFPAVTICPEINSEVFVFNYTDVYLKYDREEDVSEEEEQYFKLFSLICNDLGDFIDENETRFITNEERQIFFEAFAEMAFDKCRWLGKTAEYEECDKWFSHVITSEGLCRTFNMLNVQDLYSKDQNFSAIVSENDTLYSTRWTLDGYPPDEDITTFPRRTVIAGVSGGLQLDLFVDDGELDYICGDLQGFKVTLHHPAEDPDMDKHFRVPLNQAVVVGIRPRMISTSEEIRGYDPKDRLCYLPGEKFLSTYAIYTQQNCLMECMTNFTIQQCDCIPFYMNGYTNETLFCGAGSKSCMMEAKLDFLQREVKLKIQHPNAKHIDQCGCFPSCTSLEFDAETSQVDWDWRKGYLARGENLSEGFGTNFSFDKDHMSRLQIYYKDTQFMTSERHEYYGTVDFLASCGGLLGLFCGFSFTSLMEIIYYLTLRLISNLHKYGRRLWSGSDEFEVESDEVSKNEVP